MRLVRLAGALAIPAGLIFASGVAAQETPASPEALAAVTCEAETVTYEQLTTIIATPAAAFVPDVAATPGPPTLPSGEQVDDETATAVQETIGELVACLNAGDTMRVLALYSNRFLAENFAGLELTQEQYDQEAGNVVPRDPGQQIEIYSFSDIVKLDDGRVAVLVLGNDLSSEGEASETLFYLVEQDGNWVVDAAVETPDPEEAGA